MEKKITKREVINAMLKEDVVLANATYVAYLENELALLDKKSSNKKASATQVANENLKGVILDTLATLGKGVTVTELQSANAELGALSNQKVSAILRLMCEDKTVVKTVDKKKSYFTLVVTE